MRLFRRNDDQQREAAWARAAAPIDTFSTTIDTEIREIDSSVGESHEELDTIENRLVELRNKGDQLSQLEVPETPKQTGSVDTLDLRALMSLRDEEDDDEFGKRFKEFANAETDKKSRSWFEHG